MPGNDATREALKQLLDEGRAAARTVRERVVERVKEALDTKSALVRTNDAIEEKGPEPPVVARLMVEIRSDGTRTIARGGLEDVVNGERVAIQAEGSTPTQLAGALAKSLLSMPILAAQAVRAMKRGEGSPPDDGDGER
jgi:hypothetical protein